MDTHKAKEAQAKLARLAGRWRGEEHFPPSPWHPHGAKCLVHMDYNVAIEHHVVLGGYEQHRDGAVCFRGHNVFTYDARAGEYVMVWFDSIGSAPEIYRGQFEGSVLTLQSRTASTHHRLTYRFVGELGLATVMESSKDGAAWEPMLEGRYERHS